MVMLPLASHANSLTVTNRSDLVSVTSTSFSYVVSVTGTNLSGDVATDVIGYFGSSDGGAVAALWGISTDLGTNALGILVTNTVYNTLPGKTYWFSCTGNSSSGAVWATSSGQGITMPGGATATGNPLALVPSGVSVTNVVMPVPNPATNITFNFAGLTGIDSNNVSACLSGIVSAVSNLVLSARTSNTQISNLNTQVGIINSNQHKSGMP